MSSSHVPAGSNWNGSLVDIDLGLPEGTEVRCAPETSLSQWQFHIHNLNGNGVFRIEEGQLNRNIRIKKGIISAPTDFCLFHPGTTCRDFFCSLRLILYL